MNNGLDVVANYYKYNGRYVRRRKATSERNFGMSDKYIIRNCPICEHCDWVNGYGELEEGYICKRITIDSFECKDIENCLLKQIVELCKDYYKNCEIEGNCIDDRTCTSCFFGGGNELAQDILSNLDIEEVE